MTGSGKTLAFVIPLIEILKRRYILLNMYWYIYNNYIYLSLERSHGNKERSVLYID